MDVEERLTRLERANRRLKTGLVGFGIWAVLVFVVFQLLPPRVYDRLQAKELVVIGEKGRILVKAGAVQGQGKLPPIARPGEKRPPWASPRKAPV